MNRKLCVMSNAVDNVRPALNPPAPGLDPLQDDLLRAALGQLPTAIYITDAEGWITYYNEAAAALWGHAPALGASRWCGSKALYRLNGQPLPHGECAMAVALKELRPMHGVEAVAERPDGTRVPVVAYATPLFDDCGTPMGAINMLMDSRNRSHGDLYAQHLVSIVESSDDAIVSKTLDGIITSWNKGAESLFGYRADEAIGKSITILFPPDRLDEEADILARIRRGEHIQHYETVRRHKNGSLIDISLTVSPVKDDAGNVVGASKIARDITERTRLQEQQKLLLSEMRHRIKNSLTTVQAIAMQTLHSITEAERDAFTGRIQSLARTHELLTEESWHGAALSDVVHRALEAFREEYRERIGIAGDGRPWLDSEKSLLLAMVLHELATNAVKHGALSTDKGRVDITLANHDPASAQVLWQESDGPEVTEPKHKGFGSRLIERALGGELGHAQMAFDPRGVMCTLVLKL
jgi:PAS domain S-box-containing protein